MGDELWGRERYREVGILEAAPTVTICDGALESVFTCYGAIEIIVVLLLLLLLQTVKPMTESRRNWLEYS